ncbi:glycogen/starch synthase [Croceimicrobium sp.]|uniref:glycogen/starch synthase n=1 Tax=Croceimicrobium sp. TaxID=2828340 RepID=UPI003BA88C50
MDSKRILYVSQEIHPYLPENEISKPSLEMPRKMNESGHQVRVFMPRYGLINERRHQLHEVIRLSGINIIVNDEDQPLIIKVASVPQARMQVYFIDNDEFFKRKAIFYNEDEEFHEDNDKRAIFFCRGVIETVKKLGWSPDIIHCHGWMASFLPLYLKKFHHDDPMFSDSKTVLSVYGATEENLSKSLPDYLRFDGLSDDEVAPFADANISSVYRANMAYCDGVALSGSKLTDEMKDYVSKNVSSMIDLTESEDPNSEIAKLYEQVIVEEESLA